MDIFSSVFVLIFGFATGSFLNVVIDRLPDRKPLFISRSKCESCGRQIPFYDLVPVISYLILRGRCRFCHKSIPSRLLLVEAFTGFTFLFLFFLYSSFMLNFSTFLYSLLIASLFIAVFFIDLKKGLIMDELLVVLGVLIACFLLAFDRGAFINHLFTGIGLFMAFFALFYATSGRGMGFGDVKLAFVLGFYLGFPSALVGVYLAFLTGALVSIILIIWGKKKLRRDTIPFGPFLVSMAFVAYLFGDRIIEKVLEYFRV